MLYRRLGRTNLRVSELGRALEGHDEVLIETKYCPYDSYRPDATYLAMTSR